LPYSQLEADVMFDLITGSVERPLRERAPGSKVVSIVLHIVVLTLVLGIPLLTVTNALPEVPSMLAFVAPMPAAPPPPPPPPPPARAAGAARPTPPTPKNPATAAPIEAPAEVKSEAPSAGTAATGGSSTGGVEGGVAGGIEGGVVGGVVGGVLGGVVASSVPPPPPPAAPQGPVRVGGQIKTPDLRHRVEPVYPELAAAAHIAGVVILEASVGTDGCVKTVKVLRSSHGLLDRAATEALKQWEYSPLVLNGIPTPFVLTVTFTFHARQ
jgi:protein TonB